MTTNKKKVKVVDVHCFPPLYGKTKNEGVQVWEVTAELLDSGIARIHIQHGLEEGTFQDRYTKVTSGTNLGKKNERSIWETAKFKAKSLWNKKIKREHYRESKHELENIPVMPMLAIPYELRKKYIKEYLSKRKSPNCLLYQPKLNGVRCLVHFDKEKNDIVFQSRTGLEYKTLSHLKKYLNNLLDTLPDNTYLDGEIYVHTWPFERITSAVKRDKPTEDSKLLEYHIYDCYCKDNTQETNGSRLDKLSKVKSKFRSSFLHLVPTGVLTKVSEIDKIHAELIKKGYEGLMLRFPEGRYLSGFRSYDLVKVKIRKDDEFLIVGASKDKEGGVIWICQYIAETPDGPELDTFSVRPQGSLKDRRNLWHNAKDYFGKLLTVEFFDYSERGAPWQPSALGVRDYE